MHQWLNCPRLSLSSLLVVAALWGEIAMAGAASELPAELGRTGVWVAFETEKTSSATPCVEPVRAIPRPGLPPLHPGVVTPAEAAERG